MANIFTLENIENFSEKLNIDELYEKNAQRRETKRVPTSDQYLASLTLKMSAAGA